MLPDAVAIGAARELLARNAFDPAWPVSVVHGQPDAVVYVDEEAYA